jgi:hypothetical protein
MTSIGHERQAPQKRRDEIEREIDELRRSIKATRTHGIAYYLLLVAIIFIGFAIGYATHNIIGAVIILIGLALVAWREVVNYKARTAVLNHVLGEKLAERRQIDERQNEVEIGQ